MFLKKLKLTKCDGSGMPMSEPKPFEVMLNPEFYTVKSSLQYTEDPLYSNAIGEKKYKAHLADEITLAPFILDVTGAVPHTLSALYGSMKDVISHLRQVTFNYDGNIHESPVVQIEWGTFSYKARLNTMDVKYTLFAENGDPLRAEVSLTLTEFQRSEDIDDKNKKSSPDLTHLIEVKDGDTLPLMCNRVYKDCSYYREIAEINELDDFRHLTPGTFLYFPPLVD